MTQIARFDWPILFRRNAIFTQYNEENWLFFPEILADQINPFIIISTYYFPTPDFQTFLRLWVFILLWLQIIRSLDELKSILDTYSSALSQFLNWHWRISIIYIEVRYLLKEVLKPMFFLFGEILGFQYLSQHTVPWMESNSQKLVSRNFLDNPLLPGRNACKKSNLI